MLFAYFIIEVHSIIKMSREIDKRIMLSLLVLKSTWNICDNIKAD